MPSHHTEPPFERKFIIGLVIICLIILAINAIYFFHFNGRFSADQETWGQFGDYIGGVLNPILGFFTILAVVYTLVLQQRELKSSYATRKISEERQSIDAILTALELLHTSASKHLFFLRPQGFHLPHKKKRSYKKAAHAAEDIKILYQQLKALSQFQGQRPVLELYKHRYKTAVGVLYKNGYISKNIYNFFDTGAAK